MIGLILGTLIFIFGVSLSYVEPTKISVDTHAISSIILMVTGIICIVIGENTVTRK